VKRKSNIIYLCNLLPVYSSKFEKLTESEFEKDRIKGCKYSRKWNKIRRIVEYQEGKIC
jgi:hypothetical protein